MYGSENQTPIWKIILISLLTIFSTVRMIQKCSSHNRSNNDAVFRTNSYQKVSDFNQMYQNQVESNRYVHDYPFYNVFESRSKESLKSDKWVKVIQDSLIRFDLTSNLKISANWYFQKPIDEKVKYVLLTPEDIQITVYQFSTKENLLTNLYQLRPHGFKLNGEADYKNDMKEATYSFTYHDILYQGVSLSVKENNTMVIFAFESRDQSFKKLNKFATMFLWNHLVIDENFQN